MEHVTISELNSFFKEYVKYNTSFIDALLTIMVEKDVLQPEDVTTLNRKQVASLARLDQLEAAANAALKKDPKLGSGDIRNMLDKMIANNPDEHYQEDDNEED